MFHYPSSSQAHTKYCLIQNISLQMSTAESQLSMMNGEKVSLKIKMPVVTISKMCTKTFTKFIFMEKIICMNFNLIYSIEIRMQRSLLFSTYSHQPINQFYDALSNHTLISVPHKNASCLLLRWHLKLGFDSFSPLS